MCVCEGEEILNEQCTVAQVPEHSLNHRYCCSVELANSRRNCFTTPAKSDAGFYLPTRGQQCFVLCTLPLLQIFNLTLFLHVNQQGTQLQGKIVCSRTQEYDLYHGNLLDTKCIQRPLTLNQQGVKVWRRSTCRWQR